MTRLVVLVAALAAAVVLVAAPTGADPAPPPPTTVVNEFIPADQNLSDCISALPRPGCGSEGRSGWRQAAVFGVVVAGIAFIGWRVVRNLRRRDSGRVPPGRPRSDRLDR